jgi:HK97 family phage major capsid protein
MWGWRSIGEFGMGVIAASKQGAQPDDRLTRALSTYGSEGVGADGGFAIPPDFRNTIKVELEGEESLLALTDQLTSGTNNLTVPKDETTPWQTSGGILFNWTNEAGSITQSKPSLETVTLKLHKGAMLVPLTDELMDDAPALTGWLTRKAPQKIVSAINLAIIQGSGAGQPLGILNSPHTVSVAKVTSQDADTVVGLNPIAMYARMYAPYRRNAVWLINQDIEPQLLTMMKVGKDDTGTADTGWGIPLYMPATGLSGTPYATLFGRPVIATQGCETLGDKGDIIFAAMDQYVTVQKTGGIKSDTSIHLWFDQDTTAFRFIMRIAGQPWWNTTIAARDGSTTYSAFVTLDERA